MRHAVLAFGAIALLASATAASAQHGPPLAAPAPMTMQAAPPPPRHVVVQARHHRMVHTVRMCGSGRHRHACRHR